MEIEIGAIVIANAHMDNDLRDEGMGLQFCANTGDKLEVIANDTERHVLTVKNLDDKGGIRFNVKYDEVNDEHD